MSEYWYQHWLHKAALAERWGNIVGIGGAYFCLDKAKKHTSDSDELKYLKLWQARLKRPFPSQPSPPAERG